MKNAMLIAAVMTGAYLVAQTVVMLAAPVFHALAAVL